MGLSWPTSRRSAGEHWQRPISDSDFARERGRGSSRGLGNSGVSAARVKAQKRVFFAGRPRSEVGTIRAYYPQPYFSHVPAGPPHLGLGS